MITQELLKNVIYETIHRAATRISDDIDQSFRDAIAMETGINSKNWLEKTYENIIFAKDNDCLACGDTGWPLFFVKIGDEVEIEGGISTFESAAKEMVAKATEDVYLRPTMKHPITGYDTKSNIGSNVPAFSYKHVPGDKLAITFVAKGGGSECFGGTRYQMIAFADGKEGIMKFIIDSYIDGARSGKICPPSVIGVGIGGTMDLSAKLAKEASSLRVVGSRHPEPEIADLEETLTGAINKLGIGAGGFGGKVSCFGVNVEYAFSHIGGIGVSMAASCAITRRATSVIGNGGGIETPQFPQWFEGRD